MKLHVLGTAGYHPNGFRETAVMMIPELGILFDAGTGFYRVRKLLDQMPAGLPLRVLLSHPHHDHAIGLTFGIDVFYGKAPRAKEVWGTAAHLETVKDKTFDFGTFPIAADHPLLGWKFRAWDKETDLPFKAIKLPHPGGSTGYRLTLPDGRDIVYITDTTAPDVPVDFVKGAHTLIHEANFTDDLHELAKNSGHSTTSQVIELAKKAGVQRLILTHWNTLIELEADHAIDDMTGRDTNEKLPFELVLAKDGMVIDL